MKKTMKKDFIFLIDRSGSMKGNRIEHARKALQICLSSLPENSRFDICSFGSSHTFLFDTPVDNSIDNLSKAREHVNQILADYGGTEVLLPMKRIFETVDTHPTAIFLLTDGAVKHRQEVIKEVQQNIKHKPIQIFTCGIGTSVQRDLVKGLAQVGRGTTTYISQGERMNAKLITQLQAARSPVGSNVYAEVENISRHSSSNIFERSSVKAVFDGQLIELFFMLKKNELKTHRIGRVKVFGNFEQERVLLGEFLLKDAIEATIDIFKVAARARLKDSELKQKETKSERKIGAKLALCTNLVSKYTSLVAVDSKRLNRKLREEVIPQKAIIQFRCRCQIRQKGVFSKTLGIGFSPGVASGMLSPGLQVLPIYGVPSSRSSARQRGLPARSQGYRSSEIPVRSYESRSPSVAQKRKFLLNRKFKRKDKVQLNSGGDLEEKSLNQKLNWRITSWRIH
eukprot:snap_masked-scaffold_20-processed-gene-1.19-mRNA-1 protein AED:1.00 eAED:1.00 QI:0/-1/0/0/-1/1/1/0/453